ncbi:MAG: UvrD-helicase domain-containing protein, partial [Clostridiales bacterium]|nr:UvrD-helicase domain-containing protein [Candidatus Equinaster intestinalis]
LKLNPPETFLGERVKSYGEMDIANFFYQNGIKYQYEAPYKFDTRTKEYAQYHPDFYLPDYDTYIEYFGINKNREVPAYFTGKNGKSATETYIESMDWKFKLHKENDTKMVACYAYEKMDGTLLDKLAKNLKALGVNFKPKSPEELWLSLARENDSILDGLIELFETIINLLKSNGYTIDYFESIVETPQQQALINLLQPIFEEYNAELQRNSEIDFNDMINLAAEYVRIGKVKNHYSYVIVDEYQDISKARYSLLAELRKSFDYDLFCVGDDWQSIYRFTGSDISYILKFEKYWGKATISKIETTYRFTKSLIEISGTFITQNPLQIKKSIKGKSSDNRFSLGEINGYNDKYAVEFMADRINDLPKNASVFFIGRYSFDVKILENSGLFDCKYNNVSGFIDVIYKARPDLKMNFMTAHKSKGLQADYVFIINNKNSKMGFPSKIQDDPILDLLLDNSETFPFAEERRLYYVAMTRAKIKAYILVVKGKESLFAKEIHERYEAKLKQEQFTCPVCGGRLLHKTGPYGEFWGCENYKTTGCTYKKKIQSKAVKKL